MAGDIGIISLSYFLSLLLWFGPASRYNNVALLSGISFLIAALFIFYLLDSYNIEFVSQRLKYLFRHMVAVIVTAGLLALYFFFQPDLRSGRGVFVICLALAGAGTYYWRLAFISLFKKRMLNPKKLVIVGSGSAGGMLYHAIKDNPDYQVIGQMNDAMLPPSSSAVPAITGGPAALKKMVRDRDADILVLANSHIRDQDLLKTALDCRLEGTTVIDMPTFYETVTGKVPVEHSSDSWPVFAPLLGEKKSIFNAKLKRLLDIILSFFGLLFTLPLALIVAVAVRFDSAGGVLYRQRRVGLSGNVFTLFKFRSMEEGTDHDRQHAGKKNDPRITRVGKIIRLFRIDELPQMWNVLKGEMSFIGPRALMEEEVREFDSSIPSFSLRHSIRPGITGWAQINYRHGATVEDGLEKLQYDLFYIKNLSPFLDFLILLKTTKVVLLGKGAR